MKDYPDSENILEQTDNLLLVIVNLLYKKSGMRLVGIAIIFLWKHKKTI